ncbi:ATPase [Desulfoluna sp.]|uniref:F0F1 ATP synthase subunit B family protein n=1 Tax=Desulfoluna sp. TaxID=2045199 RepID=UPI002638DC66|nr:ATPase [Desulfoluna sp.]
MVSVDYSLLVQIVNFILLILILNIVLYKPIRGVLSKRREAIDGLNASIDESSVGVQEKEETFAAGIKEGRAKGVQLKDALIDEASQEERRIVGEITNRAQDDLAAVREKISQEMVAVRESLRSEVDDFAKAIGEKILGRAL